MFILWSKSVSKRQNTLKYKMTQKFLQIYMAQPKLKKNNNIVLSCSTEKVNFTLIFFSLKILLQLSKMPELC